MQIVIRRDFDIQPDGRDLLHIAPLLKLSGDGRQIAFQHRQRLRHRHFQGFYRVQFSVDKTHQMHAFRFARFVKAERNGRAAIADMFTAANLLCSMDMPKRDVIGGREVLRRERIQRTNINFAYRVTFTGADGG
ncbi:hypothetical protein D3C80_1190810 [compost metagenome]